jgi:hypothetical protein
MAGASHGGNQMNELNRIAENALKIAAESTDLQAMESAIKIDTAVKKINEQEREARWVRFAKGVGPAIAAYLAVLAFLISLSTLGSQIYQFNKTAEQQRETSMQTQWREALKSVSIKDDSSVLSSLLQVQSFVDEPKYEKPSRSLAVVLIPLAGSGAEVDSAWEALVEHTHDNGAQTDLISVGRDIVAEEVQLFKEREQISGELDRTQQAKFIEFVTQPEEFLKPYSSASDPERPIASQDSLTSIDGGKDASRKLSVHEPNAEEESQYERERRLDPFKRANAATWKLNSISVGLEKLWKSPKKEVRPEHLEGMVLFGANYGAVDFSGAYLNDAAIVDSDVTGANFGCAHLENAVLLKVRGYTQANWDEAHWWKAKLLSCDLAQYLQQSHAPHDRRDVDDSAKVVQYCVKAE